MKHKLIVIEGACDGIGKSTQFALLREKLEEMGERVVSHHFPSYGTPHGASVEAYLRGEFGKPETLSPYFVNSLYAVDRAVTYHSELKARSEAGDVFSLTDPPRQVLYISQRSFRMPRKRMRLSTTLQTLNT